MKEEKNKINIILENQKINKRLITGNRKGNYYEKEKRCI
jgi:hypothetical protein